MLLAFNTLLRITYPLEGCIRLLTFPDFFSKKKNLNRTKKKKFFFQIITIILKIESIFLLISFYESILNLNTYNESISNFISFFIENKYLFAYLKKINTQNNSKYQNFLIRQVKKYNNDDFLKYSY